MTRRIGSVRVSAKERRCLEGVYTANSAWHVQHSHYSEQKSTELMKRKLLRTSSNNSKHFDGGCEYRCCWSATYRCCWSATYRCCWSATYRRCWSATYRCCWSATYRRCWSATYRRCWSATYRCCWSASLQNEDFLAVWPCISTKAETLM